MAFIQAENSILTEKPMWIRSPERFMRSQKTMTSIKLHEWIVENPDISQSVFIEKYLNWLNPDVPESFIPEITRIAIENWEIRANQEIKMHSN
jgi:hypothetical protein